ncbi:hypothetical protein Tco_0536443 [Tanacetum coccineum]
MYDEDQEDEPFIIPEENSEEHAERNKDTNAEPKSTSVPPPSPTSLTELLVSSMKPEFSKLLSSHGFSSSIPTELKELPIKITALSREVKELKKHIQEFEIELLEVAELKKHTWELPKELFALPCIISSIQTHIKTLEALPSILNKVTDTLHRFVSILNFHNKGFPSTGKSNALPTEGEKNTNPVIKDAELANLIHLMGIDVVEEYHKKKLLHNKYCDKMLKRKKSPKITNCEVLTKKGPIILKIYREDGSEEVISNLKTRLDQLTQTEQELKIDLNKPLKEQDHLNELNEERDIKSKELTLPINAKHIEELSYLSNKLNRTAEAEALVLVITGANNRPPMPDKTQFSSWASRMLLYITGKEHNKLLVESVLEGPFKYGTVPVLRTETTPVTVRDKTCDELTDAEKIRESCDIKATNIILQGQRHLG